LVRLMLARLTFLLDVGPVEMVHLPPYRGLA
jgi:hypothetical protein